MARIGIEWVNNYHGPDNLYNAQKQAERFYYKLSGVRAFNWGDDYAWDIDFEEEGVGVFDVTSWVERVHIVFFSGHGSRNGVRFGVVGHDDGELHYTEAKWGNGVLNWICFDACRVLNNDDSGVFDRWRNAFDGLHIILGFDTAANDKPYVGRYFAELLNDGYTVINAWKKACIEGEESDKKWAYLRSAGGSGVNTYYDHWHGKGWVSKDPTNSWRVWTRGGC